MLKALINVRIFDYKNYIENGYVIFDELIHEVGDMKSFKESKKDSYVVIDGKGKLVMPNFVCAHSHIYSIFARGLALPFNPHNFQDILDQMWWKIDSKIDNQISYYSAIAAGSEFLLNGVTTVIDHHASGSEILGSLSSLRKGLKDVCHIRSVLCFETSDRYPVDECIKENMSFINKKHSEYDAGLFGMHASMSLSNQTLKKISKKLNGNPIHIHVAESEMDVIDCKEKYDTTIVERLDSYHLINPNSLIVHGVFISDKELDIIKDRKAYIVVNTTSNLNNAVGVTDIKKFLDKGIKVMVGNDGLSSSMATEYLNAFYLTRYKNNNPTAINLGDIVDIINNAYEYVSGLLNIRLGKLETGYVSDFMLVDYEPFTQMDKSNAFGHIFFGLFPNFKPTDVFVSGKLVVKKGKINLAKVNKELLIAKKASSELWKKVKE